MPTIDAINSLRIHLLVGLLEDSMDIEANFPLIADRPNKEVVARLILFQLVIRKGLKELFNFG